MAFYDAIPTGRPRAGWQPMLQTMPTIYSVASCQSNDSFHSQVPLPYHMSEANHSPQFQQQLPHPSPNGICWPLTHIQQHSSQGQLMESSHQSGEQGYKSNAPSNMLQQSGASVLTAYRGHPQEHLYQQTVPPQHPNGFLNGFTDMNSHGDMPGSITNQHPELQQRYPYAEPIYSGSQSRNPSPVTYRGMIQPVKRSKVSNGESAIHPQRQPTIPSESSATTPNFSGSGSCGRGFPATKFNPTAASFNFDASAQDHQVQPSSTPIRAPSRVTPPSSSFSASRMTSPADSSPARQLTSRPASSPASRVTSRPASRNAISEARRESHEKSVVNALATVQLHRRESQALLAREEEVLSYTEGGRSIPKRIPAVNIRRDSISLGSPSLTPRPLSIVKKGTEIDAKLGTPPSFGLKDLAESLKAIKEPAKLERSLVTLNTADSNSILQNALAIAETKRRLTDPFTTNTSPKVLRQQNSVGTMLPHVASSTSGASEMLTAANLMHMQQPQIHSAGHALVLAKPRTNIGPSHHLASIVGPYNNKPTVAVAFLEENMPFITSARMACPPKMTGLVRLSNIPYGVNRQEIIAFIGRNARIIKDSDEPVHVVQERVTSKTMDAYVEFFTIDDAVLTVRRYENNRAAGKGGRLGDRHVEMEVGSHEQFMQAIFPKAKNVTWMGTTPHIAPTDPNNPNNSGFQGFISKEEFVLMIKYVEHPCRSPFAKHSPQRSFEFLITTLIKYPWHMVDYITIGDRNLLFNAARRLVEIMCDRIAENRDDNTAMNERLLNRIKRACLECPGFTEAQKDDIAFICGLSSTQAGLVPLADHWYIFHTIGPKPGIASDVLLYYQALLREATTSVNHVSLAERSANMTPARTAVAHLIFGDIGTVYPEDLSDLSIAEVAELEWNSIERLLRIILFDDSMTIEACP